jgi:ADP-ribose pyrophosphatase YjhB (NUDIX family)
VGVGRIDFYHDPAAPPANSIVPSVTVAVRDGTGRILLVHKIDNDYWALPGGAVDLGESVTDAALREIAEEAGVTIELAGLVGIYTDPGHVMAYDDGEVRQQFSICFRARLIAGVARQGDTEIKAVQWVDPSDFAFSRADQTDLDAARSQLKNMPARKKEFITYDSGHGYTLLHDITTEEFTALATRVAKWIKAS